MLQTGWRKLTGAQLTHVLNLDTMEYMGERLIKGQQQYFDVCITELIGMAGSDETWCSFEQAVFSFCRQQGGRSEGTAVLSVGFARWIVQG